MSKSRDPRRLELDATPELQQVIDTLRADGPSADGLQRMTQKLEPWLDAPATAGSPSQGLLAGPVGKIGLIVLACGALLAFLPRMLGNSNPSEHAAATESPQVVEPALRAQPAVPKATPVAATPQPSTVEATHSSSAAQALPSSSQPQTVRSISRPQVGATKHTLLRARPAAPSAAAASDSEHIGNAAEELRTDTHVAANEPVTPSTQTTIEQPSAATPARVATTAKAGEVAAERKPDVAPAPDEATLLQRARRLAHDRPNEALRLLDEHGQRFAQGMLAPEREVLAIEILHLESRNAEAERRMAAFRAHYPDSVYLKRLERLQHPSPRR